MLTITDISLALFLKKVLRVKQIMMLRVFSIKLHLSLFQNKNYGSLTIETKFKVELNMGDLTSLFEAVRTLNTTFNDQVFTILSRK